MLKRLGLKTTAKKVGQGRGLRTGITIVNLFTFSAKDSSSQPLGGA